MQPEACTLKSLVSVRYPPRANFESARPSHCSRQDLSFGLAACVLALADARQRRSSRKAARIWSAIFGCSVDEYARGSRRTTEENR